MATRWSRWRVYGSIALVLARRLSSHTQRALLLAGTALLVAAIGFSRLYLGVHFLSDVLAGYAAGVAWLALLYVALEVRARTPGEPDVSFLPRRATIWERCKTNGSRP